MTEHLVESVGDLAVTVVGSALVSNRGRSGRVSEAGHDFFECCAVLRGEGASGVAKVVEPHCLDADLRAGLGPVLLEPTFAHHATLDTREQRAVRVAAGE